MRELIQRLYAPTDEAGRQLIEAALLRANPRLSGLANLPAGTPVIVPPVDGASRAKGESSKEAQAQTENQIQRELEAYREELKVAIEQEMELVKGQLELVVDQRMYGLAGEDRALREQVEALRESLREKIGDLESRIKLVN